MKSWRGLVIAAVMAVKLAAFNLSAQNANSPPKLFENDAAKDETANIKVSVDNVMLQVTILKDGEQLSNAENFRITACRSRKVFKLWQKIKKDDEETLAELQKRLARTEEDFKKDEVELREQITSEKNEKRKNELEKKLAERLAKFEGEKNDILEMVDRKKSCFQQKILYDEELHQHPMRNLILMDTSGSTAPRIDGFTKKAVLELMRVLGRRGDKFSLWEFTDATVPRTGWTANGEEIKLALDKLEAGGSTAIFDALYGAAQEIKKFPPDYTKIVFLLTDGFDTVQLKIVDPDTDAPCTPEKRLTGNCRPAKISDVVSALQESGAIVYFIDFSKGFKRPVYEINYGEMSAIKPLTSPEELEAVALATGGQRFWVNNTKEAAEAFKKITKIVSAMHILWFAPALKDPGWYDVVVEIGSTLPSGEFKANKKFRFNKNFFYRERYRIN